VSIGHHALKVGATLLAGVALATASAPAQVSLTTVVDLAQRNSSAVRLAQADVSRAQAMLSQSKDVFLPGVDFGSGLPAIPSVGFTGGVPSILNTTAQSLVFSLPQIHYIGAARSGLTAASLNLKEAREQVALDASTSYVELDAVERELDAAHQQAAFAERLVLIEQERTEAGVDPVNDLLEARLEAAQLKLARLHLETRVATLSKQLATFTGLPVGSIAPDHASIPEIPEMKVGDGGTSLPGIDSARMVARSKQQMAKGDTRRLYFPQISLAAEYLRSTEIFNNANAFYARAIPVNNFSSGFQVQVPLFDASLRAKARQSAAEALRATVEAEQAQRQNESKISELTANLRELDAEAEVASLKQQIASEQVKTVASQLELGNGAGAGAQPQQTPKAEQLALIDERQKQQDSLEAGFDLARARLGLLRALGHMEDWLRELHAVQ
jgi:outer membrane protein TolC